MSCCRCGVGGWVGGGMEEEEDALSSCCWSVSPMYSSPGWVGGWVGGWLSYSFSLSITQIDFYTCTVGGWVGGWDRGRTVAADAVLLRDGLPELGPDVVAALAVGERGWVGGWVGGWVIGR